MGTLQKLQQFINYVYQFTGDFLRVRLSASWKYMTTKPLQRSELVLL